MSGSAPAPSSAASLAKRRRDDMYVGTEAERVARTKAFIQSLKFSKPLRLLRQVTAKVACPTCGKKRLYVCYDCLVVCHPEVHPPPLALPIDVTVVYHPGEHHSKSTSLPVSTIAPNHIRIVRYPDIPQGLSPADTLVLYPSASSCTLDSIDNLAQYRHVVFVDSTWQQSKKIARDPRVTAFRHVRIQQRESLFWRFQDKDPSYLATAEAMYYFLRELMSAINKKKARDTEGPKKAAASLDEPSAASAGASPSEEQLVTANDADPYYHGEVDDLLYYYINQYILVQQSYASQTVRATGDDGQQREEGEKDEGPAPPRKFTARHFGGYVLSGALWDDLLQ
jgi:hypothetical protein